MERVSVIIPTYNRANVIARSINSILQQTYREFEIIVVDDGGKDDTEQVVKNFGDDRIFYYRLEQNVGAAGARNEGVKRARYDIVAFEDSDDVWREDKLEKQMKYLDSHPEYTMVYGGFVTHYLDGRVNTFPSNEMQGNLEGYIYKDLLLRNSVGTPTMVIKKDAFEKIGGFKENLPCLEDWEFAIRFSKENLIGYLQETLVDAYRLPGSLSTDAAGYFLVRSQMVAAHYKALQEFGALDFVLEDLFAKAETAGILTEIKNLVMKLILQEFM